MDSARWEQIQALFHAAAERPESERAAFLEEACGDDKERMDEVVAMLNADPGGAAFLDQGLPDVAYQMVGGSFGEVSLQDIGPYRLKKILGEGGMGVVWLAEREDTGNVVAIKFLPHAGLSPARRESFAREIKTLARLKHPYIAPLYDAGTLADGTPWFVMEYVEGAHFTDFCRAQERSLEERLRLFRKVCEAVQYAHGQEIIHRDLKPSNILVEPDGTPRLLDFGIAKEMQSLGSPDGQTRPGLRFLSRDYSAPEWARDGSVGLYTDVYSLGVILYEMLAGRLPSDRAKQEPGAEADSPEKPSAAANRKAGWNDLDVLCLKAMHKDASGRYQSVEALIRDIDHFLKEEPLEARPDTLQYRLGKFVARNRRSVLATAASVALLVGLVVLFTLRVASERDRANRETAIATSMNRFLSDDLLGRSDPFTSGKAQESFASVVDQASAFIEVQFRTEPEVAARLHQTIARAFDNRSDFPRARREYTRANDLFIQAGGPLSQDAILVRLQRAAMEARSYEARSLPLAKSLLKDVEATLSKIAKPREDLAVWLLSARGVVALIDNDAHAANENFLAALRRAQELGSFDEASRLQIQQRLATSYLRLGDGAKAEALYRELIEAFSKLRGPDSPNVLQIRLNLSQALLIQGKYHEVIEVTNAIYPSLVAKLGTDHEETMHLLSTRAASEGYLGMWDASIRDDLDVYALSVRKQGAGSFFSIATLSDASLSQCRAGRYVEGESNARKSFLASKQAFGPRAGITGGTSFALAICQIGLNRLPEASGLLSNIDLKAVTEMTGDPTVGASIALAQGEIAARQGDYKLAQRYADTAAPLFERPNAPFAERQSLASLRTQIGAHVVR